MKIGAIILAAGVSARLGEPKQLLKFKGETLIRRAAQTALAANCSPVVAVLGANLEKLVAEIEDLPLQIVVADDWREGMSASLRAGLTSIKTIEPNLSAVVLMLCDQPFVTIETISRLVKTYQETNKSIIASRYEETTGVPAFFAAEVFDDLLFLKGDEGARKIIKKSAASVAVISAPEAAFDVDTPEDVERLKNYL